jgi:ketosteroid isomerase-like protein
MLFFVLLTAVLSVSSRAQSKDEKSVAQAVETLRKAMVDGDEAALKGISDDALTYGHSHGQVQDKEAFVRTIVNGNSDFVTITLTDQTIHVSGDVAIVRHTLHADTNDKGVGPKKIVLLILTVWKKKHGEWKLLARQAVSPH